MKFIISFLSILTFSNIAQATTQDDIIRVLSDKTFTELVGDTDVELIQLIGDRRFEISYGACVLTAEVDTEKNCVQAVCSDVEVVSLDTPSCI